MAAFSVMEIREDKGDSRLNLLFMFMFLFINAHVHEKSNRWEGIRQLRSMWRWKNCQNHSAVHAIRQQRPLQAHAATIPMNQISSILIVDTSRS